MRLYMCSSVVKKKDKPAAGLKQPYYKPTAASMGLISEKVRWTSVSLVKKLNLYHIKLVLQSKSMYSDSDSSSNVLSWKKQPDVECIIWFLNYTYKCTKTWHKSICARNTVFFKTIQCIMFKIWYYMSCKNFKTLFSTVWELRRQEASW